MVTDVGERWTKMKGKEKVEPRQHGDRLGTTWRAQKSSSRKTKTIKEGSCHHGVSSHILEGSQQMG